MAPKQQDAAKKPPSGQLRARRSPKLIALGVICVVLGALAAAALYSMNIATSQVVTMAHDLERGDTIVASDLTVMDVPGTIARNAVAAKDIDSLVGSTALRDLPRGAFPNTSLVGQQPLRDGHSLVGLKLESGQIPTTGIVPGTSVQLIAISQDAAPETIPAIVSTTPVADSQAMFYLVDVMVAHGEAPVVANLAAQGKLAMIAEGDR